MTDVIHLMSRVYGCSFRVLLIIDDLDRCETSRIMGVLSAVTLLLEPRHDENAQASPYVSIIAIDPRVVLSAIESHFDPNQRNDVTHAHVNG